METAVAYRVTGRVQGVGFRAFVQQCGQQLGLTGWVKNHSDGSVFGVVEGEQGLLVEFLKQVKIGNRWSSVRSLEEHAQRFSGDHQVFEIRY